MTKATDIQTTPDTSMPPQAELWTPDLKLQAFKEVITALIGLILIGATVTLAVVAVHTAGGQGSADVQHILMIMVGLAGVVLGYYFGRVPAEAQATQARQESYAAKAGAADVAAKADMLAAAVDDMGPAMDTGGQRAIEKQAEVRSLREDLRHARSATLR